MSTQRFWTQRFWMVTIGAAMLGVALRIWYVLGFVRGRIELAGDAETFHLLGRQLASGEGYIRPNEFVESGLSIPTAEFPPLYPIFLASLDVVGVDGPNAQRLVGALLGGVTIVLIALLGRAVAGDTVGAVAACIAAVYPQLVVFDGSLLSEGLSTPLVALLLLAVVRARATDDDRCRLRWWIVVSAVSAAAVMTRTETLLLVVGLVVPAAIVRGDRARTLRTIAVAVSGTALVLGAWTVRNALALDHFVPFTNNSATALAGANCDATYSGVQIGGWRLDCVPELDYATLGEIEVARINREAGIDHLTEHVGDLPPVIATRLGRTFGVWDVRTNLYLESLEGRDYEWLWAAWWAWLGVASLAGVGAVASRRDGVEIWPLVVPIGMVVVTTLVTYGNQRFRMGAEPSFVVLAAIGVVAIARSADARLVRRQDPTADDELEYGARS